MPRRNARLSAWFAILLCAAAVLLAPAHARAAVTSFQAFPVFFSPNGDGVSDQVRLTWILTDSATTVDLAITSSFGNLLVRRIGLGARPAGKDTTFWDGRDSTGVLLPDGIYKIELVETPVSGSALPGLVAVTLDTSPPSLPRIDGPADTSQTESTYVATGIAIGADSVRVYHDGVFALTRPAPLDNNVPTFSVGPIPLHLGANQISVEGKDLAGNLSPLTPPTTVTWVNAPDIGFVRRTGQSFSPNGDGVRDTMFLITFLDAATTRLVVDVRTGQVPTEGLPDSTLPVQHLFDGPSPAGTLTFAWDGRDSTGTPVPDGDYEFRVTAASYDAQGNPVISGPKFAGFSLDTRPPGIPVFALPPATTFRNHLGLLVTSTGAESLFVLPDGPRVVPPFGSTVFAVDLELLPGPNTFRLQSADSAGNRSAVAGPFTIDYVLPIGFHANEHFRPNDAFVFNLGTAANEIDVTIYSLRGRRVRTLVSRDVQLHYDIPWDGKDDQGSFAGDGPYVAHAMVTFVDGSRTEAKGAVVLVK